MEDVRVEVDDRIATVTIARPPVHELTYGASASCGTRSTISAVAGT